MMAQYHVLPNTEPVAVAAAVLSVLNVVALLIHLDTTVVVALNAAVAPVVALFVRSRVTPV